MERRLVSEPSRPPMNLTKVDSTMMEQIDPEDLCKPATSPYPLRVFYANRLLHQSIVSSVIVWKISDFSPLRIPEMEALG